MPHHDLRTQEIRMEQLQSAWTRSITHEERQDLRAYILGPQGVRPALLELENMGLYFQEQPLNPESSNDDIATFLTHLLERIRTISHYSWLQKD